MSKNDDATTAGVREAFDLWLYHNSIATKDILEVATREAFGTWLSRNEGELAEVIAKQVVEHHGHRWASIAEASQQAPEGPGAIRWVSPDQSRYACPVCKQPATYARELDLYVHNDGSDNRTCLRALTTGAVQAPERPVVDDVLRDITGYQLRLHGERVVRATTNLLDAVGRYAPNDIAIAAILRFLLAQVHDSSAQDGKLWLTDDQPALNGLALWAQLDPDGFVLMLPVDA
ncbi:hypothetical protein [Streptomyces sp. ME19-01-6]|uniref:hypothetical protein n=1 Tax=Streptomyces sp. ME19-01-6 TaxID=3028686 RepID=UPI0029B17C2A|nr:hypothetical protein [Streptomyces sp. ME19-01-6]MDX3229408.1 hypothetical protein [Streptomyces sp. ME19-01-6]